MTNFFELETRFILSFSLAGFLFIVSDFVNFKIERIKKTKILTRTLKWKLKSLRYTSGSMLLLSAFSIVIFPHLPINWESEIIKRINDSIVLLRLGIAFFLLA